VKAFSGKAKVRESAALLDELMEVLVNKNKKRSAPAGDSDEERDYKRMCVSFFVESSTIRASTLMAPERCSSVALRKEKTKTVMTIYP
jgi:hypothetical protein